MTGISGLGFEQDAGFAGVLDAVLQQLELPDWCAIEQIAPWTREVVTSALPLLRWLHSGRTEHDTDGSPEDILQHCKSGDLTKLWAFMNESTSLNPPSGSIIDPIDESTLLHIALCAPMGSHRECMIPWLLSRPGVDALVATKNKRGHTPLHICARRHGRVRSVKRILSFSEVQIDAKDNYESTPLLTAVHEENEAVVDLLIAHRADVNTFLPNCHGHGETPLTVAVRLRNLPITRMLLADRTIDLHQKTILDVPFGKEAIDFAPQAGPIREALQKAILLSPAGGPGHPGASAMKEKATSLHLEPDCGASMNGPKVMKNVSRFLAHCAWCSAR